MRIVPMVIVAAAGVQVGGALGAATLTSVFLDAARADYAARLAPTGLSLDRIREVTRAWREAVGESASTGARVFAVAAVVSLACAALAWFGIRPLTTAAQGERS
jgi:hypothetical protein